MQGFLFEPKIVARAGLQRAIERLDFDAANQKLKEFQRIWPITECTDGELLESRRRMKLLHSELHARYMQRLG